MNLFELFVKLGVDDQASGKISNLSSKLKTGLATAAKIGTAAIVAVGAAATTAAKKLWDLSNEVAAAGDEIDKTSQKIGISAEAYQEWSYVFDRSGASIEGLKTGMKTLSSVITDASNGATTAAEKLSAVGLAVEDLTGKTQEQQFEMVVSALQEMGAGAERTAAASDLLGRSSTEMAAILNMTAEETRLLKNEAQEYGMVMSNDAVAASAHFQDMLTLLQGTIKGVKNNLASDLLPALSDVIEGLADFFGGKGNTGKLEGGIVSLSESLTKNVPKAVEALESIASAVATSAPSIITTLVTSLTSKESIDKLTKAGGDLLESLGNSLTVVVPALLNGTATLISNIITWLSNPQQIGKLIQAGKDIVGTLMDGLGQAYDTIGTAVKNALSAFIAFFKAPENLQDLKRGGEKLVDDFMGFLKDKDAQIKIGETAGKIVGFIVDGLIAAVNVLVTAATAIFNGLTKYLVGGDGQKGEKWNETSDEIMEALVAGAQAFWEEVQPSLQKLEAAMIEWFESIDWAQVGKDIMEEMINGFLGRASSNQEKNFNDAASAVLDTVGRDKAGAFGGLRTHNEQDWLSETMQRVSSEGLTDSTYYENGDYREKSSGKNMTVIINAVAQTPQEIIDDLRFAEVAGGIQ